MNCEFSVRVSFLELYNEELFDLLAPIEDTKTKTLRLFEDSHRKGSVIIQGLEEVLVNNKQEVYAVLERGSQQRKTAATLMNATSSRSHTIFTITVHMKENSSVEGEEMLKIGKLNLVDLAGSENIGKSGAVAFRAREAGSINQSLLTLGRVISALVERTPHIPYRESKLTRLLQDSLGGKTKTSIIATISPASVNIEESLSTLDYAHRAKNIMNRPEVNQKLTKKEALHIYTDEIERLRRDLNAARDKNGIFMDADNYNQMIFQIQAQHTELNEKMNKIKELEELIVEKEEESRQSAAAISELTVDVQSKDMLLTEARIREEKLNEELQTEQTRSSELKYLVKYHLNTEEKMSDEALTLFRTTNENARVIEALHTRLDRKQSVEDRNWNNSQRFREDHRKCMADVTKLVGKLREGHTLSISDVREKLEQRSADTQALSEKCSKVLQSTAVAIEQLNASLLSDVDRQMDSTNQQYSELTPLVNQACEKARADLHSKLQLLTNSVQTLKSLHSALQSENSKLEKLIVDQFSELCSDLQRSADENARNIDKLKDSLAQISGKWEHLLQETCARSSNFVKDQDKYSNEYGKKMSGAIKQMESLSNQVIQLMGQLKEIDGSTKERFSVSKDLFTKLAKDVSETGGESTMATKTWTTALDNVKTVQDGVENKLMSVYKDKLVNQPKEILQSQSERIFKEEKESMDKVEELVHTIKKEQGEAVEDVKAVVVNTHNNLLNDLTALTTTVKKAAQQNSAQMTGGKQKCLQTLKSLSEEEYSSTRTLHEMINSQCDHVTNCGIRVQGLLQQATGNVEEFWEETYLVDTPTGGTPMRKKWEVPGKLTVPSPHERVIARYRAVNREVQNAIDGTTDDNVRGPDDSWSENCFRKIADPVVEVRKQLDLEDVDEEDAENRNPLDNSLNGSRLETISESTEPLECSSSASSIAEKVCDINGHECNKASLNKVLIIYTLVAGKC